MQIAMPLLLAYWKCFFMAFKFFYCIRSPYRHRIHILGTMKLSIGIHSVLPKDRLSASVYYLMTVWYMSLIFSIVTSQQKVILHQTHFVWEELLPLFIFYCVGLPFKYHFPFHWKTSASSPAWQLSSTHDLVPMRGLPNFPYIVDSAFWDNPILSKNRMETRFLRLPANYERDANITKNYNIAKLIIFFLPLNSPVNLCYEHFSNVTIILTCYTMVPYYLRFNLIRVECSNVGLTAG